MLAIRVQGNQVLYTKNGRTLARSLVRPRFPLRAAAAFCCRFPSMRTRCLAAATGQPAAHPAAASVPVETAPRRRWFMATRCLNGAFTTCNKKHGFEEIAELAPCQQLNGHIAVEFVTCRSSTAAF